MQPVSIVQQKVRFVLAFRQFSQFSRGTRKWALEYECPVHAKILDRTGNYFSTYGAKFNKNSLLPRPKKVRFTNVEAERSRPGSGSTPFLYLITIRTKTYPLVYWNGRVGRAARRWKSEFSGPHLTIWRYARYLREPVWRSQPSLTAEMHVDARRCTWKRAKHLSVDKHRRIVVWLSTRSMVLTRSSRNRSTSDQPKSTTQFESLWCHNSSRTKADSLLRIFNLWQNRHFWHRRWRYLQRFQRRLFIYLLQGSHHHR